VKSAYYRDHSFAVFCLGAEMPSKDIGVTFLKRQLSRNQPVNAHALFGGFGCEGSVNRTVLGRYCQVPSIFGAQYLALFSSKRLTKNSKPL
jgi:hypothetical protein